MNEGETHSDNKPVQEQELGASPFESLATWAEYDSRGGDFSNEKEWLDAQTKSLVSWARESGYLIDPEEWSSRLEAWKNLEGGREHNVFHSVKDNRVFKYTIPPHFGIQKYIPRYAKNQILANQLFEDDITFEGVIEVDDVVSIVISQSYVEGVKPTELEIEHWFRQSGFKSRGMYLWWHPVDKIEIGDAHTGNLLKGPNGALIPIDVQITEHPDII